METVKEGLRLKISQLCLIVLVAFAVGLGVGMALQKTYYPCIELPVVNIQKDTVTVTRTLKGNPPLPETTVITRVDTVRIQINPAKPSEAKTDTTSRKSVPDTVTTPRLDSAGKLLIPISQKVYKTDLYRAVVSGWRPSLDSIEVYQKTQYITEKITTQAAAKRKWISLVVGPSLGYGTDRVIRPSVAATLGVVLLSK